MHYYYLTAKCGGTRRAAQGEILSPNYPGSYDPNMDCEYKIIAGPNMQVLLKFKTVSLKRRYPGIGIVDDVINNETSDDTLTIFDVDPLNKTSNAHLCVCVCVCACVCLNIQEVVEKMLTFSTLSW